MEEGGSWRQTCPTVKSFDGFDMTRMDDFRQRNSPGNRLSNLPLYSGNRSTSAPSCRAPSANDYRHPRYSTRSETLINFRISASGPSTLTNTDGTAMHRDSLSRLANYSNRARRVSDDLQLSSR